ncbi:type II toxin-antitoxin system RnlB family antitoxin [Solibacillus cecembensis]|uniref:type II toxin-antitoxin system RnlB family antitoxin n=1 Tax=Solibacillus cecembensis TaxID=459347 RepID=UPI003D053BB9
MKTYFLYCNDTKSLDFQYMVIANSYESPLKNYTDIEDELSQNDFSGYVLFDMLAYSGNDSRRFFSVNFDGNKFDFSSLDYLLFSKESNYRKITQDMLRTHYNTIDNTVLDYIQKNMIMTGITL